MKFKLKFQRYPERVGNLKASAAWMQPLSAYGSVYRVFLITHTPENDCFLSPNSLQLATDTNQMGFPKGRSEALPFGRQRSAYSVDDIKLICIRTTKLKFLTLRYKKIMGGYS